MRCALAMCCEDERSVVVLVLKVVGECCFHILIGKLKSLFCCEVIVGVVCPQMGLAVPWSVDPSLFVECTGLVEDTAVIGLSLQHRIIHGSVRSRILHIG